MSELRPTCHRSRDIRERVPRCSRVPPGAGPGSYGDPTIRHCFPAPALRAGRAPVRAMSLRAAARPAPGGESTRPATALSGSPGLWPGARAPDRGSLLGDQVVTEPARMSPSPTPVILVRRPRPTPRSSRRGRGRRHRGPRRAGAGWSGRPRDSRSHRRRQTTWSCTGSTYGPSGSSIVPSGRWTRTRRRSSTSASGGRVVELRPAARAGSRMASRAAFS